MKFHFTRFPVDHNQVQCENDYHSDERGDPVDEEHNADAKDESYQTQPHVVILLRQNNYQRNEEMAQRLCREFLLWLPYR